MAAPPANQRGWGPGWPTDRRQDMARVTSHGVTVLVHKLIAPLVAELLDETVEGGYQLRPDECWGYASRPIRGTNTPSNHSWGLAVDLNSRTNPMGSTLVTDMPPWMTQLWKSRGFRWGGDYSGRKDAMHFEFMGTPADVGGTVDPGNGQPDDDFRGKVMAKPVLRRGSKGQDVRILQGLMIAHNAFADTGGHVDGDFGSATEAALRRWQARTGRLQADGICGPQTWAWLVGV